MKNKFRKISRKLSVFLIIPVLLCAMLLPAAASSGDSVPSKPFYGNYTFSWDGDTSSYPLYEFNGLSAYLVDPSAPAPAAPLDLSYSVSTVFIPVDPSFTPAQSITYQGTFVSDELFPGLFACVIDFEPVAVINVSNPDLPLGLYFFHYSQDSLGAVFTTSITYRIPSTMYDSISSTFSYYIYGVRSPVSLSPDQQLTLTILSTVCVLFVIALPFILVLRVIRFFR